MSDLIRLALTIPCSYCNAQPKEWCVTRPVACRGMSRRRAWTYPKSGWASDLHMARTGPVWRIREAGRWEVLDEQRAAESAT